MGFLSGPAQSICHKRDRQDAQFAAVDHLQKFFPPRNKSPTQAASAWVLALPDVISAIVGATFAAQLRQSLPAPELTPDSEQTEVCKEVWLSLPA